MQFPIKKQQTVDIYLIKDKTVIFNGTNFKMYQVMWGPLLRLHLKAGSRYLSGATPATVFYESAVLCHS